MRLIPFEPDHIKEIELQHAQAVFGVAPHVGATGLSGIIDGRVVGAAGVIKLWDGVGQAWALLSEEVLRRPLALCRAARWGLPVIEEEEGYRRIQASVADGHLAGHRWAKFLGFEIEGFMKRYGPGGHGDFWLYARYAR